MLKRLFIVNLFLGSIGFLDAQSRIITHDEYEILKIEDSRDAENPLLRSSLQHNDPNVVARAILAMGRIAKPEYINDLAPISENTSIPIRMATAFAIGQLQTPEAAQELINDIETENSALVRAALYKGLGSTLQDSGLAKIEEAINDSNESLITKIGAVQALGILLTYLPQIEVSQETKESLILLSQESARLGSISAFTLSRLKVQISTISSNDIVNAIANTKSDEARALLTRTLAYKPNDVDAQNLLLEQLKSNQDNNVKIESVRALSKFTYSTEVFNAYRETLENQISTESLKIETINSIKKNFLVTPELITTLNHLVTEDLSTWVQGEGLLFLIEVNGENSRNKIDPFLNSNDPQKKYYGILSLAHLKTHADKVRILNYLKSSDLSEAKAAAEALSIIFEGPTATQSEVLDSMQVALNKGDLALHYYLCEFIKENLIYDLADKLAESYQLFQSADDVEAKVAILETLGVVGSSQQLGTLETALQDPVRQVALAAAAAIEKITHNDVRDQIPPETPLQVSTPDLSSIKRALSSSLVFHTDKGNFVMRMNPLAPLTSAHIYQLVMEGFYNGLNFHRVVPAFVAQGGDPRGDGFGGPGFFIRDETSSLWHERGAVGIATAGKDTGGCQFFINHTSNLYLDGHYTIFAYVVEGMDVVDQLGQGSKIFRVEVIN